MSPTRAVIALVLLAAAAAAALAGLNLLTRERIVANEARRLLERLQTVLPASGYDNQPHLDRTEVLAPEALGSKEAVPVFRARRDGKTVALAVSVVAPDGYVDRIRLLVGISADGEILGVRPTQHSETPGLGDGIEPGVSDWILGFDGLSLASPAASWRLARDGGDFDQLSGATVTSRAVLNAVRDALEYTVDNYDRLSAPPADQEKD